MTNPTTTAVTESTDTEETTQFTPAQRKIIYLVTFTVGVVTIVTAPVVAAVSAPAWIPALIGGLGSAASIVSATFGWKYVGK